MSGAVQVTMRIGARPASDALARVEELARAGKLTEAELEELLEQCGDRPRGLFRWVTGTDGAPVLAPSRWLAALIERAGAR